MSDRTAAIKKSQVLLFTTIKDEYIRLPYFLEYYRNLGVGHFLFVDNGSSDEGPDYLKNNLMFPFGAPKPVIESHVLDWTG